MITQQDVLKIFSYDESAGDLVYRRNQKIAGSIDRNRKIVSISGKRFTAHSIIWLYNYGNIPKEQILHINSNRLDNRLCNLRLAAATSRKKPDQSRLKMILNYNKYTGIFTWNNTVSGNPANIGDVAGSLSRGYIALCIDSQKYYAHVVAWIYEHGVWPTFEIDHINHNKTDNRIINLREVSRNENCKNLSKHSNNTSGFNGVHWCYNSKRWKAVITVNSHKICLGYFKNKQDAADSRSAADVAYGFHKNHGK